MKCVHARMKRVHVHVHVRMAVVRACAHAVVHGHAPARAHGARDSLAGLHINEAANGPRQLRTALVCAWDSEHMVPLRRRHGTDVTIRLCAVGHGPGLQATVLYERRLPD